MARGEPTDGPHVLISVVVVGDLANKAQFMDPSWSPHLGNRCIR